MKNLSKEKKEKKKLINLLKNRINLNVSQLIQICKENHLETYTTLKHLATPKKTEHVVFGSIEFAVLFT
jgi:hypothetical protein